MIPLLKTKKFCDVWVETKPRTDSGCVESRRLSLCAKPHLTLGWRRLRKQISHAIQHIKWRLYSKLKLPVHEVAEAIRHSVCGISVCSAFSLKSTCPSAIVLKSLRSPQEAQLRLTANRFPSDNCNVSDHFP